MRHAASIAVALAVLANCARPSARIAEELQRYGLDPQRAQCVGQRLERDLSIAQLQQLAAAAHAYGTNDPTPGRLDMSDLARVAGTIRDPAVPVVVVQAAGSCGVTALELVR
jgi:hypothetical protein